MLSAQAITAICAVLTLIGLGAMFVIKTVIRGEFSTFTEKLDGRYATKEHVAGIEVRVGHLEDVRGFRHHGAGA